MALTYPSQDGLDVYFRPRNTKELHRYGVATDNMKMAIDSVHEQYSGNVRLSPTRWSHGTALVLIQGGKA